MCLGIPGRVTRWIEKQGPLAQAEIEFDGVRRVCHMACVPDAEVGDYVIVHAGIGISRIEAMEAQRVLDDLRQLGEDEGWRSVPR